MCPPQVILPVEPYPALMEVRADEEGKISGSNLTNVLINNELWKGSLDKCNDAILRYNSTITPQ